MALGHSDVGVGRARLRVVHHIVAEGEVLGMSHLHIGHTAPRGTVATIGLEASGVVVAKGVVLKHSILNAVCASTITPVVEELAVLHYTARCFIEEQPRVRVLRHDHILHQRVLAVDGDGDWPSFVVELWVFKAPGLVWCILCNINTLQLEVLTCCSKGASALRDLRRASRWVRT